MENDYLNPEMPPVATAADTTTPRIFGVLNIIFSLLAACMAAYVLMMAFWIRPSCQEPYCVTRWWQPSSCH